MWAIAPSLITALFYRLFGCGSKYRVLIPQAERKQGQHRSGCHHISVLRLYNSVTETMNKIISTDPHCFLMVVGPSGSGKTYLVSQLLKQHHQIFKPNFQQFLYFYNHFQPIYQELQVLLGPKTFHLCQGVDWSLLDKASASNQHTLVIFDDVYQEVAAAKVFEPRDFRPTSETTSAGPEAQFVPAVNKLQNDWSECYTIVVAEEPTRHKSNWLLGTTTWLPRTFTQFV